MSVVKNLIYKYSDGFQLNLPHWEIPDKGITALRGDSGSGKTSVIHCLLGFKFLSLL